jgi:hypothetical protein
MFKHMLLQESANKQPTSTMLISCRSGQQHAKQCINAAREDASPGAEAGLMPLPLLQLLPIWGLPGRTPCMPHLLLLLPLLCISPASLCRHLLPLLAAAAAALPSHPAAAALPGLLGLAGLTAPARKVVAAAAWLRCTLRAAVSSDAARRRSAASSCFTLQQRQRRRPQQQQQQRQQLYHKQQVSGRNHTYLHRWQIWLQIERVQANWYASTYNMQEEGCCR